MTGHDAEEFGGELYYDIVARIEQSWSTWLETVDRIPPGSQQLEHLTISLIDETMSDDDRAVELIRQLLEDGRANGHSVAVNTLSGSPESARQNMLREHERLLGAIEAASRASDDVLHQVQERIGAITWMRYEERSARLKHHIPAGHG